MLPKKIKIFADGAKMEDFVALGKLPYISGFTTNPTLMKKAGVKDYSIFVKKVLSLIKDKPVSFEVIADDFCMMKKQALKLSSYGKNVYVKIPITNTKGETSIPLIRELLNEKVKVNVTAIMTYQQIVDIATDLKLKDVAVISIFAGRMADTGVDPMHFMSQAVDLFCLYLNVEVLWASPRELLNIFQAEEAGCDIITAKPEILNKIKLIDYNLEKFSLDTVKMFYNDAVKSGLEL